MTITEVNPQNARTNEFVAAVLKPGHKLFLIGSTLWNLFLNGYLQLILTSELYNSGFQEPLILVLVTHGLWLFLWPLLTFLISLGHTWKTRKNEGSQLSRSEYFRTCVVKQFHHVHDTMILLYEAGVNDDKSTSNLNLLVEANASLPETSSTYDCVKSMVVTPPFRYVAKRTAMLAIPLTVAGFSWCSAMSMMHYSDVMAINYCSGIVAYAFSILMLGDRLTRRKLISIVLLISGVLLVTYTGAGLNWSDELYPNKNKGKVLISVGSVAYGYFTVYYKKYLCMPAHLSGVITGRRQQTFAIFVMGLLAFFTVLCLLALILLAEVFNIHHFSPFGNDSNPFELCFGLWLTGVASSVFNFTFFMLTTLTSPVLSSFASMGSIFWYGLLGSVATKNGPALTQASGYVSVIAGFAILLKVCLEENEVGDSTEAVERFLVSEDSY